MRVAVLFDPLIRASPPGIRRFPSPNVNKQDNTVDLSFVLRYGKGIAYGDGVIWKHTPENLRENPEPNSASKGTDMGRWSPVIGPDTFSISSSWGFGLTSSKLG
jgi:hypothetical protein